MASSCSVNAEEHVLEVKKMENERKKAVVQFEEEDVGKQEEDWKMEVDEKTDSRETLEMRKWNVMKDMRKFERVKFVDESNKNVDKEDWQKELALVKQRKNELLPGDETRRRCLNNCRFPRTNWHNARKFRASSANEMNKPGRNRGQSDVCTRSPGRGGVGFGDSPQKTLQRRYNIRRPVEKCSISESLQP